MLILNTQGIQNLPEIALSPTVLKTNDIFHSENSQIFRGHTGVVLRRKWIENWHKITLSFAVFEINDIFHFPQNSRWRLKFGKF